MRCFWKTTFRGREFESNFDIYEMIPFTFCFSVVVLLQYTQVLCKYIYFCSNWDAASRFSLATYCIKKPFDLVKNVRNTTTGTPHVTSKAWHVLGGIVHVRANAGWRRNHCGIYTHSFYQNITTRDSCSLSSRE